jgi:hypothetical protein
VSAPAASARTWAAEDYLTAVGQQLADLPDEERSALLQPLAADGVPVTFSFPQNYVLDPEGVTRFGWPVSAGQCIAELPRPEVPLPVFPASVASSATAPTSGG